LKYPKKTKAAGECPVHPMLACFEPGLQVSVLRSTSGRSRNRKRRISSLIRDSFWTEIPPVQGASPQCRLAWRQIAQPEDSSSSRRLKPVTRTMSFASQSFAFLTMTFCRCVSLRNTLTRPPTVVQGFFPRFCPLCRRLPRNRCCPITRLTVLIAN